MTPLCPEVTGIKWLVDTDRPRSCWMSHTDLLAAAFETGAAQGYCGAAEVQVHGPVTAAAAGVAHAAAASGFAMRQKNAAAAPGLAAAEWSAGVAAGSGVQTAVVCEADQATGGDVIAALLSAAHDAVAAAGFVAAATEDAADDSAAADDM